MLIKHKLLTTAFTLIFLPVAASAQSAGAGLETLLQCKPGTSFTAQTVEAQFTTLGLVKGKDGIYLPSPGNKASLFGGEILAAGVFTGEGEKKVTVYLSGQTGKQLSKKLGVTQIDEEANTEEPSYVKQGKKRDTD